jgi:hypothetical protein
MRSARQLDDLIDEGIAAEHVPLTDAVWKGIRRRGSQIARGVTAE